MRVGDIKEYIRVKMKNIFNCEDNDVEIYIKTIQGVKKQIVKKEQVLEDKTALVDLVKNKVWSPEKLEVGYDPFNPAL